jgi:hypothetical protein
MNEDEGTAGEHCAWCGALLSIRGFGAVTVDAETEEESALCAPCELILVQPGGERYPFIQGVCLLHTGRLL